jgi:hypothetical protein
VVGDGLDLLALKVDDIDAALREAERLGHPYILEVTAEQSRWAHIDRRMRG